AVGLADLEEREPEVVRAVGPLLEELRRADLPLVARARGQVLLERLRRGGRVARVEFPERALHLRRVAIERMPGIPPARPRRERERHEPESPGPPRLTPHGPSSSRAAPRRSSPRSPKGAARSRAATRTPPRTPSRRAPRAPRASSWRG